MKIKNNLIRHSIWILHLFAFADIFLMEYFRNIRRLTYNANPYIVYSVLRLLILGILITVYITYGRFNKMLICIFILFNLSLAAYMTVNVKGSCETELLLTGILLTQLFIYKSVHIHRRFLKKQ